MREMKNDYTSRFNKVIEYINNHIDEKMDLETLAGIAHFSTFHFHRLFKAFQQETLAAYITRMRVETAARFLRYSTLPIETIAYNIGYDMPSSLSKAFKQYYGITPRAYRNDRNIRISKMPRLTSNITLPSPNFIDITPRQVIYIRCVGAYCDIDFLGSFEKLWRFVNLHGLNADNIEYLGIYHDDPTVTEKSKLRSDICLVVDKSIDAEGEIGVKKMAGGKYVCFTYRGAYENLGMAYDYIFGSWFIENQCEVRDSGIFEKYIGDPQKMKEEDLRTEIYVPVK
jgi:AraC family transcriptional regulator